MQLAQLQMPISIQIILLMSGTDAIKDLMNLWKSHDDPGEIDVLFLLVQDTFAQLQCQSNSGRQRVLPAVSLLLFRVVVVVVVVRHPIRKGVDELFELDLSVPAHVQLRPAFFGEERFSGVGALATRHEPAELVGGEESLALPIERQVRRDDVRHGPAIRVVPGRQHPPERRQVLVLLRQDETDRAHDDELLEVQPLVLPPRILLHLAY
mmetsp:Transcript_40432/g.86091  ORF Transcript_40432/g.86091 Transcript_40432/m.86091 type:complete len:209 (+) Transcript_40432:608-1234(+)